MTTGPINRNNFEVPVYENNTDVNPESSSATETAVSDASESLRQPCQLLLELFFLPMALGGLPALKLGFEQFAPSPQLSAVPPKPASPLQLAEPNRGGPLMAGVAVAAAILSPSAADAPVDESDFGDGSKKWFVPAVHEQTGAVRVMREDELTQGWVPLSLAAESTLHPITNISRAELNIQLDETARARALARIFNFGAQHLPRNIAEGYSRIISTALEHPDWSWDQVAENVNATDIYREDLDALISGLQEVIERQGFAPGTAGYDTEFAEFQRAYADDWSAQAQKVLNDLRQMLEELRGRSAFSLADYNRAVYRYVLALGDNNDPDPRRQFPIGAIPELHGASMENKPSLFPIMYERGLADRPNDWHQFIVRAVLLIGPLELLDLGQASVDRYSVHGFVKHDWMHFVSSIAQFLLNTPDQRPLNANDYINLVNRQIDLYEDFVEWTAEAEMDPDKRELMEILMFDRSHELYRGLTPEQMLRERNHDAIAQAEGVARTDIQPLRSGARPSQKEKDLAIREFQQWLWNHPQSRVYRNAFYAWIATLEPRQQMIVQVLQDISTTSVVTNLTRTRAQLWDNAESIARARLRQHDEELPATRSDVEDARRALQQFDHDFNEAWVARRLGVQ